MAKQGERTRRNRALSFHFIERDNQKIAAPPQTWACVIARTVSVGIPAISLPKISRKFPPVSIAASWDFAAADAASWDAWNGGLRFNFRKIPWVNIYLLRQCFDRKSQRLPCGSYILSKGFKAGTILNFHHITSPYNSI